MFYNSIIGKKLSGRMTLNTELKITDEKRAGSSVDWNLRSNWKQLIIKMNNKYLFGISVSCSSDYINTGVWQANNRTSRIL